MKGILSIFFVALLLPLADGDAGASQHYRDVIYAKHDGVALTMDIFQPVVPNGAGIIRIVSGGWRSDHRQITHDGWPDHGYTTFVVVHGSVPHFTVEETVADLHRAVRFIRANASRYGVEPGRLGVIGYSAGGHLSLMLATRGRAGSADATDPVDRESSEVQAVACFHPATDFLNWRAKGDNTLITSPPIFGRKIASAEGWERLGRDLSPASWVSGDQPPVFIVHGDADAVVPVSQSLSFFERCTESGARCEILVREGVGHDGWMEWGQDTARIKEWFDLHLLGRAPSQPFSFAISKLPGTAPKRP